MKKIKYDNLVQFHKDVLSAIGLDEHSRESVTVGLCETSLRGVDSHGVKSDRIDYANSCFVKKYSENVYPAENKPCMIK
jgi:LDH2 family malate/lactate/ureidoglycolate dehydrogenase